MYVAVERYCVFGLPSWCPAEGGDMEGVCVLMCQSEISKV